MKKDLSGRIFEILNCSILILIAVLTLYPLWYVFMYSFSDPAGGAVGGVYLLPRGGYILKPIRRCLKQHRYILHTEILFLLLS